MFKDNRCNQLIAFHKCPIIASRLVWYDNTIVSIANVTTLNFYMSKKSAKQGRSQYIFIRVASGHLLAPPLPLRIHNESIL